MRFGFHVAALALTLAACGSVARGSYGLESGDANYDAVKAASDKCAAQGGQIRLRSGFDGRELSNYVCKIGKAR